MKKCALLLVLLAGCSTPAALLPHPNFQQNVIWQDGKPVIFGENGLRGIIWPLEVSSDTGDRLGFFVAFYNPTSQPVDIAPEQLVVTADGAELKVLTPAAAATLRRRSLNMQRLGAALSALGAASSIAEGTMSQNQAASVNQTNRLNLERAEADGAAFESTMLQRQTLLPGGQYGGNIYFEGPSRLPATVTVQMTTSLGPLTAVYLYRAQ